MQALCAAAQCSEFNFISRVSREPHDRQFATLLVAALHDRAACMVEVQLALARCPPGSDENRVATCLAYVALQPDEVLREMLAETAHMARQRARKIQRKKREK